MIEQHKITVVVPIYNEELNIENCIKGLQKQSNQDFIAIFIDDGSTDNSVPILKKLLENADISFQHKLIQQTNSGAAKAREAAINQATTEYIMILDCDDRISADTIANYLQTIDAYAPDIILPKAKVQQDDGSYQDFHYFSEEKELDGFTCFINSLGGWGVHGWVCARTSLFLKSYKKYKEYNPQNTNYINNDEIIVRLNYFYADKVIKNDAIYYYENNKASTTKRVNPNRYLMCNNAIILCKIFRQQSKEITKAIYKELINTLFGIVKYAYRNSENLPNMKDWLQTITEALDYIQQEKGSKFLSLKGKYRLYRSKVIYSKLIKNV